MINFIIGCILGFLVGTVGFTGIAQALDGSIDKIKSISISVEK
jgi:hypothetical protein